MTAAVPPEWRYLSGRAERTGRRYPLGELFAYSAVAFPDRLAIADGRRRYTCRELELGARRLAHYLHVRGVRSGDAVAILAEKIALIPILAVAVWKLGAVYAPLDDKNPPARLQRLISDLAPAAVLGPIDSLAKISSSALRCDFTTLERVASDPEANERAGSVNERESATAYIIFTSGSTGAPKGVMISHRSLLDYFFNHNRVLRFDAGSRVFSMAPFHFDVSIEDTLLPLSLGAYVYQFGGVPVGSLIRALLRRERVTHLIAVSTLLSLITENENEIRPEHFPELSMVMTGAEVCDPKVINCWVERMPGVRVINAYGPTETTIVCLTHQITAAEAQREGSYPIGQPLDGVRIRIVDANGEVTESGREGELWIGGSQVMQGYLNDPVETARVIAQADGEAYYRTGDVCRYNTAGDVEFVGRVDDEVKIAGRRIRLGEVRQLALGYPGISRVAVGVTEARGWRQLAMVLVAENAEPATADAVLRMLKDRVPDYMVPAVVAIGSALRMTSTGKTDESQMLQALARAYAVVPARIFVLTRDGRFISEEALTA